jgi:hypothetical protein
MSRKGVSRKAPPRPEGVANDALWCWGCLQWLPATEEYFYRQLKTKRGWASRCKRCHIKDARDRRHRAAAGDAIPKKHYSNRKPLPEKDIVASHLSGTSVKRLADTFKVNRERILEILQVHNVPVQPYVIPRSEFFINANGYRVVYIASDDPHFDMSYGGCILEHRLIIARHLGRSLRSDETVHHINGDRADNRIDNLQLRFGQHGSGVAMECLDCGSSNVQPVPLKEAA